MPTTEALIAAAKAMKDLRVSVDRLYQALAVRSIIMLLVAAVFASGLVYVIVRQQESDRDFCGFVHSVAVLDTSTVMNQQAPSVKIVLEARRLEKTLSC